jgi:hypothetical protein
MENAPAMYKTHIMLAGMWLLLTFPTWYLWRYSLFWVAFISLYANFVSHWGAAQAARAEIVAGRAETESQRVAAAVAKADQNVQTMHSQQLARMLEILDHLDDRTNT